MIKPKEKKAGEKAKGKPKHNTRTKYDWDALKMEFIESEFIDVAPFMVKKFWRNIADGWKHAEKIKWWWEEKKQIGEELRRKALEDFKTNIRKQWECVYDKLEQAHVKGLESLTEMILEQGKIVKRKTLKEIKGKDGGDAYTEIVEVDHMKPYLQQFDIISILKHIKLEKGEPTDIVETGDKSKWRAWLDEMKKAREEGKDISSKK